jgi:hypothetical protein
MYIVGSEPLIGHFAIHVVYIYILNISTGIAVCIHRTCHYNRSNGSLPLVEGDVKDPCN